MNTGAIVPVVIVAVIAAGGFYAFQSGLIELPSMGGEDASGASSEEISSGETSGTGQLAEGAEDGFVACPAVCVPMWNFNSVTNECSFVECGSGCGPDNVETFETEAECESLIEVESADEGTPISGKSFTVEQAESTPRLCETDDDCKIIPVTCNQCDCGRAVNNWIAPYQCTEADKANPCNFECPASKAVCDAGVCEKVDL